MIRNVQLTMNISNPMHPLDALFAKIPLHSIFESVQSDEMCNEMKCVEEMENTSKFDRKFESESKFVQ